MRLFIMVQVCGSDHIYSLHREKGTVVVFASAHLVYLYAIQEKRKKNICRNYVIVQIRNIAINDRYTENSTYNLLLLTRIKICFCS